MTKETFHSVILMSNSPNSGPVLVLPFFRPISIYEIEDDFDSLVEELKALKIPYEKELIEFLKAFKESLSAKNVEPLFSYFMLNMADDMDLSNIQPIFEALGNFIDTATDVNRPMH